MTRLILFALVCAAAWYGWKNYTKLRPTETHNVVVMNHSGYAIERLRISGGGETVVVETLEDGATVSLPMPARREGTFNVLWKSRRTVGEREWHGGKLSPAPELMTYRFEFDNDERMRWSSSKKPAR